MAAYGKLRSGSDGDLRVQPQLGNLSLAWQPRFTWSLGATVVGVIEGGERTEAGLSQAYPDLPADAQQAGSPSRAGQG